MLRIQIASDLHFEFHEDVGKEFLASMDPTGVDALILGGDIGLVKYPETVTNALAACCEKYGKVFYYLGNHEFYKSSPAEVDKKLAVWQKTYAPRLEIMQTGKIVEFMGRRFLGDTMWFPDDPMNAMYKRGLSDFSQIRDFVPWVYERNAKWRKFLDDNLREGDIVLTHHLPSYKCVADRYEGSPYNRFFVSDEEQRILERKPALWVHGHTHSGVDTVIGSTRVVCNPFGYVGEDSNAKFNEKLVIEI